MNNNSVADAKQTAKFLVETNIEYANDLYFALDELFVKKSDPYDELTKIMHQWVNPSEKVLGYATVEDAGDGSGDAILKFPEGMCDELGWEDGDTVDLELSVDGTIHITKIS